MTPADPRDARRRQRAVSHVRQWLDEDRLPYLALEAAAPALPAHFAAHLACPDLLVADPHQATLALTVVVREREGDVLFLEVALARQLALFDQLFRIPTFAVCFGSPSSTSSFWTRPALYASTAAEELSGQRFIPVDGRSGLVVPATALATATLAHARGFQPA